MTRIAELMRLLMLVFSTVTLSSCTSVLVSNYSPNGIAEGCHSNAGSYRLPKRYLKATITGGGKGSGEQLLPYALSIETESDEWMIPDSNTLYCLDFLFSGFAVNKIGVGRKNMLLQKISSESDDQTGDVSKNAIRAVGNLVANRRAQNKLDGAGRSSILVDSSGSEIKPRGQFDPFDKRDMQLTNQYLKRFGYCIYLDDSRDSRVPAWSPGLCGQPSARRSGTALSDRDYRAELDAARDFMHKGVLYRPEISHRIKIMRRLDPDNDREPWHFAGSDYVKMPNRAPVFALSITRANFVKSSVNVDFNNGLVQNVTIDKPSELNAFIDIPIYAIAVVLDIPAATLRIFQNEEANRRKLMATNIAMIQLLEKQGKTVFVDEAIKNGQVSVKDVVTGGAATLTTSGGNIEQAGSIRNDNCLSDDRFLQTPEGVEECQRIIAEGN